MSAIVQLRSLLGLFALCFALALGTAACGDDDEETPPDEGKGESGKGGSSSKGGTGGNAGSGDGGVVEAGKGGSGGSSSAGKGGSSGKGGSGGSGEPVDRSCDDEDPPTTTEGFLNRDCGSDCEPFDNEDRIEHAGYAPDKALDDLPDP